MTTVGVYIAHTYKLSDGLLHLETGSSDSGKKGTAVCHLIHTPHLYKESWNTHVIRYGPSA